MYVFSATGFAMIAGVYGGLVTISLRQHFEPGASGIHEIAPHSDHDGSARCLPHGPGGAKGSPQPALNARPFRSTPADLAELVERHISLVSVLVSDRLKQVPAHIRRDELMSAGLLALVLSAATFDPERGVPFRNFATFRIRGALIDELRTMDWATRSVRSRAREAETIRAELSCSQDRPVRLDDIADSMGISVRELDGVYADRVRGMVLSLNSVAIETMPDDPSSPLDCPESLILRREQLGYLHDAVAALPERLRTVVIDYYFRHRQMSDIAADLSVTPSRVSQLCTEAIALIRGGMNSQLDPAALQSPDPSSRGYAARNAYYSAVARRNTMAGRLDMSTSRGEMRRVVDTEQEFGPEHSRIA